MAFGSCCKNLPSRHRCAGSAYPWQGILPGLLKGPQIASASFTVSVGVHGVFIRLLQKEERGRERGNSEDWDLTFRWVGHPEISPEFLDGRHPGRDAHLFCDRGERIG